MNTPTRISFESVPYEIFRTTGGNSYVHLADGYTNYELSGNLSSTVTAVLIHGGTIPLGAWEPQMEALLRADVRILRYDQYGRGFSDRPAVAYDRGLFRRQLLQLLDALHIDTPVTLVGPSFGGAIAINFAAHHPQRVAAMMLVSPAVNLLGSDSSLARVIGLLRVPRFGELLYKLFLRSKIIARGRALIPGGKGSPCDTAFVRQFSCRGTQAGLFSMFRSDCYGDYREETRTAGNRVPRILLVRGKKDTEITSRMVSVVRADLQRATFVELEKSGHGASGDAPEDFNRLMLSLLAPDIPYGGTTALLRRQETRS